LDEFADPLLRGAANARQVGQKPTRRVLVQVCVPRSDNRNLATPGEVRADQADVTGPGDVQHVRLEGVERRADPAHVPPQGDVEIQVVLERARRVAPSLELEAYDG